ncbi:cation-translocating P-type ATPase [Propioniciclava sp. MC1595]|uniref:cation-translocating P-type ATPase n=1 Tax=Propioniciclava sp. MC1595 TaxID=2760308 RepID=UPI0016627197|nr:cation-translocating P-type ATPase [Propioniciclava sp. MC1595]MBB1496180.1 cation-translocating P-type ATPase [Propioniciclava sp. MC1595]
MTKAQPVADPSAPLEAPWASEVPEVLAAAGSNPELGLTQQEAARRLADVGPNELRSEPAPSAWKVAVAQLADPMNLMLLAVGVVSLVIAQVSTAVLVGLLVVLNLVLGTRQELAARASIDALSRMQIPQARVVRDGILQLIDATSVVPGDLVQVESGDVVPADGRVLRAATLETQEAALTGESAPIGKSAATLADAGVALGDRANMLFQNTSVTRGTGSMVVTTTGMHTEVGRIADMLTSVKAVKSPLQNELNSLTRVIGMLAWGAVAVIVTFGLGRGQSVEDVLLLGVAMALSAIPTGLPTFVQMMLSYGASQLAEAKAVVKSLPDVETLGSTSAINTDKTGTLTLNEMMASTLYYLGRWYSITGEGYRKSGEILHVAGEEIPDFTRLSLGLALASDATVSDAGEVVGDPTEAALVVLAAKVGVDAEPTRREYPRIAEVPFDSDYKFMATVHDVNLDGTLRTVMLVKGAPDVVIGRSSTARQADGSSAPIGAQADVIARVNAEMGGKGLRVLAFAMKEVGGAERVAVLEDPMSAVAGLDFIGLVGIIDPLRPSAKEAVRLAHAAGIEVRMITGDHAVTAAAIGEELGLGPGAISGAEFRALSDQEVLDRLDQLHVFGRVSPQDKLRLVQLMQSTGQIVAMTGDAVNDAAALKQADIGVAMGSGSEVTKQAGKMILTDDNFGTLVHAVQLGRGVYEKILGYINYQMSQLISLVLLFLVASLFAINDGVAMSPLMVLFLNFFVASVPVFIIIGDPVGEGIMNRPPRDPKVTIANRRSVLRWLLYGFVLFLTALLPLVAGPDQPHPDAPSISMTMTAVVVAFATVLSGISLRRIREPGFTGPLKTALKLAAIPLVLTVLATELGFLQAALLTTSLTLTQWLLCAALAAITPAVIELDKALQRRRATGSDAVRPEDAVAPARARGLARKAE